MREKGNKGKIKNINIRLKEDEKRIIDELSAKAGMTMSEYLRSLFLNAEKTDFLSVHLKIVEKYEDTLAGYKKLFDAVKQKGKG
jgi:hypothetical protein